MDFVTVFFAYAVSSHMFGNSFSKPVAIAVTVIYSLFSLVTFFTLVDSTFNATELISGLNTSHPDSVYEVAASTTLGLTVTLGPLIAAWLASVIYLHVYVRGKAGG